LCVDTNSCPVESANIRLVKDPDGELYQLNIDQGLIRLSDEQTIIPPGSFPFSSEPRYGRNADILVGLQGSDPCFWGRPIMDVAFDPQFASNNYVYVVPVVVDPAGDPNLVYTAAARLELPPNGDPPYEVIEIYDDPNAYSPNDNRELDNLREIEIDSAGYLYVINAYDLNESDILWVYDADNAEMADRLALTNPNNDLYLPAPTGMHISQAEDMLYLGSSQGPRDANSVSIYGLSTNTLEVNRTIEIAGMRHITGITEDPSTGSLWVAGFSMEDIPPETPSANKPPFYYPYLAEVPSGSDSVEAISLNDPNNCDLALPLSIVWTGSITCAKVDFDGDTKVNLKDFAILAWYWLDVPCNVDNSWCEDADTDKSGWVDLDDLFVLTRFWMETNCD
jgi:hypothetical protein